MTCPHCRATELKFDPRVAEGDLRQYRRRGPNPTTRRILEGFEEGEIAGRTVLDIGAGIGALSHELLAKGAAHATLVDASPAYLEAARQEAARRGTLERMEFRHGDAATADLPRADLVTLDRVVCCYPDAEALLRAAAGSSTGSLSLSFPRDRWYVRIVFAVQNTLWRLMGNEFRIFVHPESLIRRILEGAGMQQVGSARMVVWKTEKWELGR